MAIFVHIFTQASVSSTGLRLCAAHNQASSLPDSTPCISKQAFKRSNPELRKQNRLRAIRESQLTI